MAEEEDFYIEYKSNRVRVSPVINGARIYFIIHLNEPVTIAEGLVNECWVWFEMDKGETILAAELGGIIEDMNI